MPITVLDIENTKMKENTASKNSKLLVLINSIKYDIYQCFFER